MHYIFAFLSSMIMTYCSVPAVIKFAKSFRLVDDPKIRPHPANTHTGIIPRAGGLAIYIGIIVGILIFAGINPKSISILIGGLILVITGIFDDKHDVHPYTRLTINIVVTLILIASGIAIPYITNPLGGIIHLDTFKITISLFGFTKTILPLADIFAFVWILWTMSIIGWSAGVDGQMPGFVTISSLVLAALAWRFTMTDPSQTQVVIIALITAGAFAGFIPWNFFPQKIMPGYGGKTLAGMLLAILGILSYGKVGTMLLVLGIPTADAIYTLFRRIIGGKSPIWADRGHLHHRLLQLGWGKRRIALFYWGVSAILGLVALTVNSTQKLFVLIMVGVIFGGLILWISFFTQFLKQPDQDNG